MCAHHPPLGPPPPRVTGSHPRVTRCPRSISASPTYSGQGTGALAGNPRASGWDQMCERPRLWSLPWAPGTGGGFASILLVTRRPPGLQTACGFPSGRRSYLQLHLLCSTRINWKRKAGLAPEGRGPPQRERRGWGRPRAQRTALPRGGEASGAPARGFRITCVPHAGAGRGL